MHSAHVWNLMFMKPESAWEEDSICVTCHLFSLAIDMKPDGNVRSIKLPVLHTKKERLNRSFLFSFLDRVAGESYAEFLEYLSVYFAEHHCRVYLTSVKFRQLLESFAAVFVMVAEH